MCQLVISHVAFETDVTGVTEHLDARPPIPIARTPGEVE